VKPMTNKSDVEHRIAKYCQAIEKVFHDFQVLMLQKGYSATDFSDETKLREIKNELKQKYPSEVVDFTLEMSK